MVTCTSLEFTPLPSDTNQTGVFCTKTEGESLFHFRTLRSNKFFGEKMSDGNLPRNTFHHFANSTVIFFLSIYHLFLQGLSPNVFQDAFLGTLSGSKNVMFGSLARSNAHGNETTFTPRAHDDTLLRKVCKEVKLF